LTPVPDPNAPPTHGAGTRPAGNPWSSPIRISLLYAAGAAAWILFSDRALQAWLDDPAQLALASAIKGWGFVAVTAFLL
jgi:hypothetical protein